MLHGKTLLLLFLSCHMPVLPLHFIPIRRNCEQPFRFCCLRALEDCSDACRLPRSLLWVLVCLIVLYVESALCLWLSSRLFHLVWCSCICYRVEGRSLAPVQDCECTVHTEIVLSSPLPLMTALFNRNYYSALQTVCQHILCVQS